MPDLIFLPKISASILGGSYPIQSVDIDVAINTFLTFSVTITSSDAKDGDVLTVTDIRKLAAKAQDAIYKTPKQSNISVTVSGYKGGTLNVEGILTNVQCTATTGGGLSCTFSATGNDCLLQMLNYSLYLDYINVQTAAKSIYDNNKLAKDGPIYCMALSPQQRESTGDSIAKRIYNLIKIATEKWKSFSKLSDQPSTIKKSIESIASINEKALGFVKKFLGRSDKTSKLFNGKCSVNQATSNQVMNGLHSLIFAGGSNFFQSILGACGQFQLWYLPKLKDKGNGYLENCKFGNEDSGGSVSVYGTNFQFNSGSLWEGRPPCIGVAVRAQSYVNTAGKVFPVGKTPASRILVGSYPKKQSKQFGATYILNAPGWLSLPLLSGEDSGITSKSTSGQFKKGELQRKERNAKAAKINYNAVVTKQKPNVDNASDILSYLAEKEYYRALLSPSTAVVSGSYGGAPTAEVGDMVSVEMSPGGQVVSGILSRININLSPTKSSITYNLNAATVTGSSIK
jgi:hypothetical protein